MDTNIGRQIASESTQCNTTCRSTNNLECLKELALAPCSLHVAAFASPVSHLPSPGWHICLLCVRRRPNAAKGELGHATLLRGTHSFKPHGISGISKHFPLHPPSSIDPSRTREYKYFPLLVANLLDLPSTCMTKLPPSSSFLGSPEARCKRILCLPQLHDPVRVPCTLMDPSIYHTSRTNRATDIIIYIAQVKRKKMNVNLGPSRTAQQTASKSASLVRALVVHAFGVAAIASTSPVGIKNWRSRLGLLPPFPPSLNIALSQPPAGLDELDHVNDLLQGHDGEAEAGNHPGPKAVHLVGPCKLESAGTVRIGEEVAEE